MVLTDAHCRGEKPGPTRRKLSDCGGLQFWVLPNGKKSWTLIYQYRGRQKSLALAHGISDADTHGLPVTACASRRPMNQHRARMDAELMGRRRTTGSASLLSHNRTWPCDTDTYLFQRVELCQ